MFFGIDVLKNFANFTGKHLCWTLFLIKFQAFRCFHVKFAKSLRTPFFTVHLRWLLLLILLNENENKVVNYGRHSRRLIKTIKIISLRLEKVNSNERHHLDKFVSLNYSFTSKISEPSPFRFLFIFHDERH